MFIRIQSGMIMLHFSNLCKYCAESVKIVSEILVFVKREAVGPYAENQKIAAVRKVYQKGIMTPIISVDLLWKDYCAFEMVSCMYSNVNNSFRFYFPEC